MHRFADLRLLRLAVARGLLSWGDIEAVAGGDGRGASGSPDAELWLRRLLEEGRVDPDALERLRQELTTPPSAASAASPTLPQGHETGTLDLRRPSRGRRAPSDDALVHRDLEVLADWERYEVISFLGAGGMGAVYKAFDPSLLRFVALKLLHAADGADGESAEGLLREARAQARIDHPHVCQVYEVGEVGDRPYIAMQLIAGERLDEAVAGLPRREILELMVAVARAVHAAHRTGLVHRDLKPGNVLVVRRASGRLHPYVVDFGLAEDLDDPAIARREGLTGTPGYLAPEQVRGGAVDHRTDVYSLGVVLYQLLSGALPFRGDSVTETLLRIVDKDAPSLRDGDPSIDRDVETIVRKCLEKDPARRYDSARALAEDLDRYLAGEPILARAPSVVYRLGKVLRRNRTLAAVVAGAVVLLAALATWSLDALWQARERAELAQRFGQEVKDVESTLRWAVLLPLHDTSEHQRAIRERMRRIGSEMETLGDLATGPGEYALGQGHLALHEYERAREHLERAWRGGYQEPETAAALGRALGYLYLRSATEGNLAGGRSERRAFLEEIERTYRAPAVSYLRESAREGVRAPEYVAGLLALYEERYDDALVHAGRAARAEPTFYEAQQLVGDVYVLQGNDALEAGEYDQALTLYARGGAAYEALQESVRSDPGLYLADCGRRMQELEVHVLVGRLPTDVLAGALSACNRALVAAPGLAEGYSKKARIYWRVADHRMRRGEDPRLDIAQAIEAAGAAIVRDPRDMTAYGHLSIAHRQLADWEMSRGLDPTPSLASAIAAAGRAIALAEERPSSHNSLGNAYFMRARYRARHGGDPRPDLELAIACYGRALALQADFTPAANNLGAVWKAQAEYEIEQGLDPAGSVEQAIAALEGALAVNPRSSSALNNLGSAHLTLADYQLARGLDPRQALERAATAYRRALDITPEYPYGFWNLAFTERTRGRYLLRQNEDPGAALTAAREALAEAERLNPTDSDNALERARVELLAARWAAAGGDDPRPALASAATAVAAGLALNPDDPTLHLTAAQLALARAEHDLQAGRTAPAIAAVGGGLAAVEQALSLNPSLSEGRAVRGALRVLGARARGGAAARELARQASEDFAAAFAGNSLLAEEYADLAREASPPPGS